jgi:putative transcriptional regulator
MSIRHKRSSDIDLARLEVDWAKVDATTDEDIARQAAADPDTAPPASEEELDMAWLVQPPLSGPALRHVRERMGLTQAAFAARFGFALGTLRQWEQGRRQPEGPARTLLQVIAREPDAVRRALER